MTNKFRSIIVVILLPTPTLRLAIAIILGFSILFIAIYMIL
ncbi:hypothetical protein BSPA14S_I0036 (plasmid) [Borreliella spielmanii A14S]|uniref:Uncharacterized protein n=1 Tax=Borreliella spielmanii A14S TaxID=498742 RepID=C0RCB5_9SPIR|nr:hypothetical protein BSPA14S_I0036 [Borreliella spielmanii A14S]